MELFLQSWRYKIRAIHLTLGNINPKIHINTTNECPSVSFERTESNNGNPLTQLVQIKNRRVTLYRRNDISEIKKLHKLQIPKRKRRRIVSNSYFSGTNVQYQQ
ncbi:unnamed protein product [Caenorhabditis nigoni]